MQIQLQQKEIEAALAGYITQQGIDLSGKQVTIEFTAGRKASGLSAELTIEDVDFPDFSELAEKEEVMDQPTATIVSLNCSPVESNTSSTVATPAAVEAVDLTVTGEAVKTSSLFS